MAKKNYILSEEMLIKKAEFKKAWIENKKQRQRIKRSEYSETKKNQIRAAARKYRKYLTLEQKEKDKERRRKWRAAHKKEIQEYSKKYYEKNKERLSDYLDRYNKQIRIDAKKYRELVKNNG